MTSLVNAIQQLEWTSIEPQLDAEGFALLPGLIDPDIARGLAEQARMPTARHSQSLASEGLGQGEVSYFAENLPAPWSSGRNSLYRHLAPIANRWNQILDVKYRFPDQLEMYQEQNRQAGQTQALSHVSRLVREDYLSLHQRNIGAHVFPMQVVVLLSEPGADFSGGEFVMTEQRPRMQSRPMVLPLRIGDAAVISTAERPFRGTKGYYRVNMKHAISRVRNGERIGVELSFHGQR